jgi:CheY-like chemotaxis protein
MAVRILVVDDSAAFRGTAVELLTWRGYAVIPGAVDRTSALDVLARGGCPGGALIDVNLPGDDGLAVAEALRAACPSVRVVLTSSEVEEVTDADLLRCGAVAFVAKDRLVAADLGALFGDGVGDLDESVDGDDGVGGREALGS